MVDGALIQMLYCFTKRKLSSHRLAYFPSPALLQYDEAVDIYEQDELFGDMFAPSLVKSPLRFDFDSSDDKYVDIEHPKSHLSLGQYKNCRIPVWGAVTPLRFMRFILRNFYYNAYVGVNMDAAAAAVTFPQTISKSEKNILFVSA